MNKKEVNMNHLIKMFNNMADDFNRTECDGFLFPAAEFLFDTIESVDKISFEKTVDVYNKAFSLIREDKYKDDLKESSSNVIKSYRADEKKLNAIKGALKKVKSISKNEKAMYEELENTNTYRKEYLLLMVWKVVAREAIYRETLRILTHLEQAS